MAKKTPPRTDFDLGDLIAAGYQQNRQQESASDEPLVGPETQRLMDGKPVRDRGIFGVTGDFGKAIWQGAKGLGRNLSATADTLAGDNKGIEETRKAQMADDNDPAALKKLQADIQAKKEANPDAGWWDVIKGTLGSMADNKEGAAQFVGQQLPNVAVSTGTGLAAMHGGAAIGTAIMPGVGTVIGGGLGYLAGSFLGNALLEVGGSSIDKAEGGLTDQERKDALKEGAIKSGVITAVESATLGTGKLLAKTVFSGAAKAGAAAEAKVLAQAGVDITQPKEIVKALANEPLRNQAVEAGKAAAKAASSVKGRVAKASGDMALESLGEGGGEYIGTMAATGKGDKYEAVMEALSAAPGSAMEMREVMRTANGNNLDPIGIVNAQKSGGIVSRAGLAANGHAPAPAPAPVAPATPTAPTAATPAAPSADPVAQSQPDPVAMAQQEIDELRANPDLDESDSHRLAFLEGNIGDPETLAEMYGIQYSPPPEPAATAATPPEQPAPTPAPTEAPATPAGVSASTGQNHGGIQIDPETGEILSGAPAEDGPPPAPVFDEIGQIFPDHDPLAGRTDADLKEQKLNAASGEVKHAIKDELQRREADAPPADPGAIDVSEAAPWRRNIGKAKRLADQLGIPHKGMKLKVIAKAIEQAVGARDQDVGHGVAGEKIDDEWTAFSEQSGTLGIPRAEMPQVKAEHRGAMVNFLKAKGIEATPETIPSRAIKPTQAEFSPEKVKSAMDFTGGDRAIIVSADGHVVDGHHQWLAKREKGEPIKALRLDTNIREVLDALKDMPSAQPEQAKAPASDAAIEAKADEIMLLAAEYAAKGGVQFIPTRDEVVKLIKEKGLAAADKTIATFKAEIKRLVTADSKQFASYAKWIADGKIVSPGMREQIQSDERLAEGEAGLLLAMVDKRGDENAQPETLESLRAQALAIEDTLDDSKPDPEAEQKLADLRAKIKALKAPEKAKWLKAITDNNRLAPAGAVQLAVTPKGGITFMGDPEATKAGRAMLGAFNAAKDAGATDAEIAEAIKAGRESDSSGPKPAGEVVGEASEVVDAPALPVTSNTEEESNGTEAAETVQAEAQGQEEPAAGPATSSPTYSNFVDDALGLNKEGDSAAKKLEAHGFRKNKSKGSVGDWIKNDKASGRQLSILAIGGRFVAAIGYIKKRGGRDVASSSSLDSVLDGVKLQYPEFFLGQENLADTAEPAPADALGSGEQAGQADNGWDKSLPEGEGRFWVDGEGRGFQHPEFAPNKRQQALIDAVERALDAGAFYGEEVQQKVAQDLGVSKEVLERNRANVQGGDFGYHVYHARHVVEARRAESVAAKIRADLALKQGDKLGTLIFNDFKVTTGVEVTSVSDDGRSVSLKGKRGSYTVTFVAEANSVKYAIDRAHEKSKRKDGYEDFVKARGVVASTEEPRTPEPGMNVVVNEVGSDGKIDSERGNAGTDTSPDALWRKNWAAARDTAEALGLPTKDGKRNLKLTELVPAIDAKLKQPDSNNEATPSADTSNVIGESANDSIGKQILRAEKTVMRLRTLAKAGDLSLEQKLERKDAVKKAEEALRKMRQNVFSAEDAANAAISAKDASLFAEHKELFPSVYAELAKSIGNPVQASPPASAPTPTPTDVGAPVTSTTLDATNMTPTAVHEALMNGHKLSRHGETVWVGRKTTGTVDSYVVMSKEEDGNMVFTKGPVGASRDIGWGKSEAAEKAVASWDFDTIPVLEAQVAEQDAMLDSVLERLAQQGQVTDGRLEQRRIDLEAMLDKTREQIRAKKALEASSTEVEQQDSLESIFAGLQADGEAKSQAEQKAAASQFASRIEQVEANFHDALIALMEAGTLKVNGQSAITEDNRACL